VTWQDERDYFTTGADIYAKRLDDSGNALWVADGVSLCVATNAQWSPEIVSDGSGGAIVTWPDQRDNGTTGNDIYAQRVDGNGNALWVTGGVSLCVATGDQYNPQIVYDGSGGAIVTWKDERGSDDDIYAQRVDGNGNTLWVADGVSLCVTSNAQWNPRIVSDGSGGAIVTWNDQRDSDDDIYAQRVDGSGNALWYANGVTICVASNIQSDHQIASDGYWGAIVTWEDYRDGATTGYDIYAQRVGGVGDDKVSLPLVIRKYP
jgi:hypothetical protein